MFAGSGIATSETRQADTLRRRRAASYRCEPLADGRHDPIDKPRPRRAVTVRAIGRHSVEFDGPGVWTAITDLCLRYMRSRDGGGWLVQQQHADDLMSLLEVRGHRLEVIL